MNSNTLAILNISASGVIKFLAGSCLSGLGIVLKEPPAIWFYG